MPTICIDCRYISDRPSGIAEVVANLVKHAPPLSKDLNYLLLRNLARAAPLSEASNAREIAVPYAANGPVSMWLLPQLTDLSSADVFHAPANILPAGLKMKTLTTVHDVMWLTHPRWCNPSLYGRIEAAFYQHGIRRALSKSDRIAAVSMATKDAIQEFDVSSASRLRLTRSGVSEKFRRAAPNKRALDALGIPSGKPYVLIVGQNAPYKNHVRAMRAFADAFAGASEVQLVVLQRRNAGGNMLGQLAQTLGIGARTHFLRPVGFDQLVQLYSAATVLLHPSLCEGFGNPLAEAMACGCPVITSNRGAMMEVTADAAICVDPLDITQIAEALRQVFTDSVQAERMSKAGLARAAQLKWTDFAEANIAIYRELLTSN